MTTAISEGQAEKVCKKGQGEQTCSFLGLRGGSWQCLKGSELEHGLAIGGKE